MTLIMTIFCSRRRIFFSLSIGLTGKVNELAMYAINDLIYTSH